MKTLNQSRGSIVLAAMLFAVSGVSVANAAKIEGANPVYNAAGTSISRYVGTNSPNGSVVTVTKDGNNYTSGKNIFGGYLEGVSDVLNNTVSVTLENLNDTRLNLNTIQAGYSVAVSTGGTDTARQVNNNSVKVTGSKIKASIWAGRADDSYIGNANYNTTIIDKSDIEHVRLRGAISYATNGTADYNTLFVKDSTMYADGSSFEITGGFSQDNSTSENNADLVGTASYNQLIYDGVTTYAGTNNKNATSKNLFAGIGRQGEANNNRAYVRDLNKKAGDGVTIQTNVVGGATWRGNSGGAQSNIAVAVGESKIANIYGGAVGLWAGDSTGKSNGANDNLVILDLSGNGKVTENVYGGYISDTTNASTTGNAVYFMQGNIAGAVIGGNAKEKAKNTGNTLILGNDTSTWGERKAGQISNFENLNFNVLRAYSNRNKF